MTGYPHNRKRLNEPKARYEVGMTEVLSIGVSHYALVAALAVPSGFSDITNSKGQACHN